MGLWRRRAEDRAVQQWRRELDRRLDQPLDLDDPRVLGELGPTVHRLDGGLPPEAPARPRRSRGPLLPGVLVIAAVLGFVALTNPGSTAYWAKEVVRRASGGTSSSYAFLRTRTATGEPVAWDHCEPIRYRVNPRGAPTGWAPLVRSAMDTVSEASGFELVYDGTTRERDFLERRPGAPVLVGWGDPTEFDQLAGDVAGFGGATAVVLGGRQRYVTGEVLLDEGDYAQMATLGRGGAMRLVLVHELLHVLGLDHVDDRRELMYPTFLDQGGLGPGDEEGLQRLGDVPCG